MEKRNCNQCGKAFILKRNPKQRYCSAFLCQGARKKIWRKEKHENDPDYRDNKRRANQKWLEKNINYWRKYRACHLEYTISNRQHQQIRDKKRINGANKGDGSYLAKSDALNEKTLIKSGTYKLIPCLAKSDALTVKISLIS